MLAAGVLAIGVSPFAVAATGDEVRQGVRNRTVAGETSIIADADAGPGRTGGYATRQSNRSTTGGGAIYGCRSGARKAPEDERNPCVRANNLADGLAFELHATAGDVVGRITAGAGGDGKRPFTTNATGVATGLNADRVDGLDAEGIIRAAVDRVASGATDLDGLLSALEARLEDKVDAAVDAALARNRTRWVLIDEDGRIEAQSGGFTVKSGYVGNPAGASENVYVDAGEDLTDQGITATLGLQNQTDVDGDGVMNGKAPGPDANPEFSGEVTASRCGITGIVACAPAGTNNANHFVVSPRNSDGSPTTAGARKRFQVTITP
ncbi:MAG: hypothetical protein M0P31_01065 [Solirubrobacteraceae bacterium]|nr:hypothetical protein [Solirubrobacteraceae bacterium]